MLRPVPLLPALVAVVSVLGWLVVAVPAGATAPSRPAVERTPLAVTIDTMSPAVIPEHGPIRVTGTVTNRDDQTWTGVQLYALRPTTAPMTTGAELADAAATDEDAVVGERILTEGTYDDVGDLAPGASVRYVLRVPRSEVTSKIDTDEAGVYWFGVHALGASADQPDDLVADGRARTFLPLIPPTQKTVDAALVVPVRRQISHAPDGSIADLDAWTASLSEGGALRSMADIGTAAGSRPLTWLVDPAVPDTVRDLVAGNPARSLAPTLTQDGADGQGGGSASPDPSSSPSGDEGDGGDGDSDDGDEPLAPGLAEAAEAGSSWLDQLHAGLEGSGSREVLTLPYGDVDVAAAAAHDPQLYRAARKRSNGALPWDISTSPVVSSPSGYIDEAGIRLAEAGTPIVVTDQMFGTRAPSVARVEGHPVAVASSGAVAGGPGPGVRLSPLALRQRVLSEAAVRLLTRAKKPLVVVFPSGWAPHSVEGFFSELDQDWLRLTTLSDALDRPASEVDAERLDYPESQSALELDATSFTAADELSRAGETLQNLLTRNDQVASDVRDEALTDLSYSQRLRPDAARASADQSRAWIESRLRSVRIDAKAVILSSGSGRFAATITNDLDQPVTVRIQAVAESPLEVTVPRESIELGPSNRATVLLHASSPALGIRNVKLLLTDTDDVALGSFDDVPIRSNRVSSVIWLILGVGVALLLGAIVLRLFRRIRAAART